ncbi:MAG: penicillin-binding protein 1C [Flavobacteriales bacterium]|nr:penicillin-binding protein 1C [Flavobacteriales bacterium]
MDPLFNSPRSTVLVDRNGQLLGASVAADGQWRFPTSASVPEKFATCLLQFEDRHFYGHHGVRLQSLVRAFQQNQQAGRKVRGGSTLTMQVARMSRGQNVRSYSAKLIEALMAVRIELRNSKKEILSIYAGNAPFGGNVVGLDAAAWRWFGRAPDHLTWAESATLAVLPNAPSAVYPGKGRSTLRRKRDSLLDRLLDINAIDSTEWTLAKQEPLPGTPLPLPQLAPHLLSTLIKKGHAGAQVHTTIDAHLQLRATEACDRYAQRLVANEVHNAAALIIHVPTGEVRAYIGNLTNAGTEHANRVDLVRAQRSTGSVLKPLLYADMLQSGEVLSQTLLVDVPTQYDGFRPRNYDEQYSGAVPLSEALARSLNVPAVRSLRKHGVDRTLRTLRAIGFSSIDKPADHYGLSLIVGGAESSLWEISGAYASMARVLGNYGRGGRHYRTSDIHPLIIINSAGNVPDTTRSETSPLSAASISCVLTALREVHRPDDEMGWQSFADHERISWKTGTSFGHRDAWAIGTSDQWCVAVWSGNASGEGRPGLTGTLASAPLMFDLFRLLPKGSGFEVPFDEMTRAVTCHASGYLANNDCPETDTTWIPLPGTRTPVCPYHRPITVDLDEHWRVPAGQGKSIPWFSLPPAMERYYALSHPAYRPMPPLRAGSEDEDHVMEVLYPEYGARLLIPTELDGSRGKAVMEIAHRDMNARVHWDMDGKFLGTTVGEHRMAVDPADGTHLLALTDDHGRLLRHSFVVVSRQPR